LQSAINVLQFAIAVKGYFHAVADVSPQAYLAQHGRLELRAEQKPAPLCLLCGQIQHRRGVFTATALEFNARAAGALGVAGRLRRRFTKRTFRHERRRERFTGFTKRTQTLVAVLLRYFSFGRGHHGVEIGLGDRPDVFGFEIGGGGGLGSGFSKFGQFGEAAAEYEMRLSPRAIDRALLLGGFFVDHGIEVEFVDAGKGFFYEAAAAEAPCGSHNFGRERLFEDAFGSDFFH